MKKEQQRFEDVMSNKIILRSVYGKVGIKYLMQPCINPRTGRYPDCVKQVNSQGDMILTDAERNSGKYYIAVTDTFIIEDGKVFNLDDEIDAAQWEAIRYNSMIAPSRDAKDSNGKSLIDGDQSNRPGARYGAAELYIYQPGVEAEKRVSRKRLVHNAIEFILNDEKGYDGRVLRAKLLGKYMQNQSNADVEDYLIQVAEKDPERIINLYTGDDIRLRLLFIEAKEKRIIIYKNKVYLYGDNIVLGATDDAVIAWMKDSRNKKVLDLIMKDVFGSDTTEDTK